MKQENRIFKQALVKVLDDAMSANNPERTILKVAEVLVDEAVKGNVVAIRELADRLEGKPSQTIEGDFGGIVVQVVKFNADTPHGESNDLANSPSPE